MFKTNFLKYFVSNSLLNGSKPSFFRNGILLIALLLTNCSSNDMKPIDFKDQKPRLIIEDYLSGNVKAWGILQNRSGKVTRQFSANLNGKWDGTQ